MKRRDVLRIGAGTAMAIIPAIGCAQGAPAASPTPAPQPGQPGSSCAPETIVLTTSIARNHGHGLVLGATDALKLLRQTKTSGFVTIDIQGSSGHAHGIELTHENILTIVVEGTLTKDSTVGASHSHAVTVTLELK